MLLIEKNGFKNDMPTESFWVLAHCIFEKILWDFYWNVKLLKNIIHPVEATRSRSTTSVKPFIWKGCIFSILN